MTDKFSVGHRFPASSFQATENRLGFVVHPHIGQDPVSQPCETTAAGRFHRRRRGRDIVTPSVRTLILPASFDVTHPRPPTYYVPDLKPT